MTTEEYIKAMDIRTSRRTFKNTGLDEASASVIKDLVNYVNKEAGLNFVFFEDGRFAFNILTGMMSMIAVCGADTVKAREACGYYGETIVLQCAYHGISSCWVSGSYNENKVMEQLNLPKGVRLYCVIALGFAGERKSAKEKLMYAATHKKNKPYQKMFEACDEKLPEHFVYAMKLVEKAPSAVNRRPVQFRYEKGCISASVSEPYSDKSIDFGIAQLHFQLGCAAMGVRGKWVNGSFAEEISKILKFPEKQESDGEKNDE